VGNAPPIGPDSVVTRTNGRISFATFEVDLSAGELRKNGVKIKLHGQPFEVLAMLLERPGGVVTREELQQKLWASDTFVDFEHGLNKAINKVREALGDAADNPRYIQTLPRRGYRFIGPIAPLSPTQSVVKVEEKNEAPPPRTSRRKRWVLGLGLAGLCVLFAASIHWIPNWTRSPRVLGYRPLTADRQPKGVSCGLRQSALVTDGPRVFFAETGSPVSQVAASGGEIVKISSPVPCFVFSDISPDKTELLGISQSESGASDQSLWRLSVASGQAQRVGNLIGHAATWAPDGERIAYATGNDARGPGDVYIASKEGSDARKLVRFEKGSVASIRWSPVGNVLRMAVWEGSSDCSLWEISADGTYPHRITLFPGKPGKDYSLKSWTPDGRYSLLTVARPGFPGEDIWVLRETQSRFLRVSAEPTQLTTGAMSFWSPVPSPDGKRIFAIGGLVRGQLVRYDLRLRRLEPYLSGISADHVDFSRDGKWVTYVTYPEENLWRSRVGGSDRMQLTMPPLHVALPRWSPDGTRIAFTGRRVGEYWKIYVVSSEGGKPETVAEDQGDAVEPTWSPDGNSLIFGPSQFSAQKISSVDLRTSRVSVIPESRGLYTPRMSPDGQFIVAEDTPGNSKLLLFDEQTQKWTVLLDGKATGAGNIGYPQWSGDSKYVYVKSGTDKAPLIYRVGVADHKLERVAQFEVPEGLTGVWGSWVGVTPDGSPLVLRDLSIQEIYSLDVDLP
jgi:Tol biopolymer transport system component/DNA-binding winged helix-turn-helix (wHTH) protein